jgi:hypothetical protein
MPDTQANFQLDLSQLQHKAQLGISHGFTLNEEALHKTTLMLQLLDY